MNIDRIYECDIYKLIKIENCFYNMHDFSNKGWSLDDFLHIKRRVDFIKTTLVYYNMEHNYCIDLETNEKYKFGVYGCVEGDMFVDTRKKVLYVSKLFDTKRKHYSKKKILKKYIEYKDGENNECK